MERKIDIVNEREELNIWVRRSIDLFETSSYLDDIASVYPLSLSQPERLNDKLKRNIIKAHQARQTETLLRILEAEDKFPYDEPVWYLMKNIKDCMAKNPNQKQRVADSIYAMTAEETVIRLESAPKLNTQIGPMFSNWLRANFASLNVKEFAKSKKGICVLNASEEDGKTFVNDVLKQRLSKRPDLVAKVNEKYVIGEAKWIGSPGGNQNKQVVEVIQLCSEQRGDVLRVGIIDGYPWAVYKSDNTIIYEKTCVQVQESEYDIVSALLLKEYLQSLM